MAIACFCRKNYSGRIEELCLSYTRGKNECGAMWYVQKMMKSVALEISSLADVGICLTSARATAPRRPAPIIMSCDVNSCAKRLFFSTMFVLSLSW